MLERITGSRAIHKTQCEKHKDETTTLYNHKDYTVYCHKKSPHSARGYELELRLQLPRGHDLT